MFITRFPLYILSVLISWITISSCNDVPSSKIKSTNQYKTLQIEINSPYACYNEIQIDSTGSGTALLGFRDSNGDKSIKKKKEFIIHSDSDNVEIRNLINRIGVSPRVNSTHGHDLYHFTLVVNDKKLIDKYGPDSLMDNVLKILLPYAQIEDTGQCDYFNLWKQALGSEKKLP